MTEEDLLSYKSKFSKQRAERETWLVELDGVSPDSKELLRSSLARIGDNQLSNFELLLETSTVDEILRETFSNRTLHTLKGISQEFWVLLNKVHETLTGYEEVKMESETLRALELLIDSSNKKLTWLNVRERRLQGNLQVLLAAGNPVNSASHKIRTEDLLRDMITLELDIEKFHKNLGRLQDLFIESQVVPFEL